jgi:hypothetical protein
MVSVDDDGGAKSATFGRIDGGVFGGSASATFWTLWFNIPSMPVGDHLVSVVEIRERFPGPFMVGVLLHADRRVWVSHLF